MELQGKAAIVTGGGRGIGRATGLALAAAGAFVAIVDRDEASAESVAQEIRTLDRESVACRADVSEAEDVTASIDCVLEQFGRIDYLFANAGDPRWGALLDISPTDWDSQIGVNLKGVFLYARACLPAMIEAGGGVVVATSSDCAIRSCRESAAYTTAKHGVIGLMRCIAVDYGRYNIRANTVVPGYTETPGFHEWNSVGDRTPEETKAEAGRLSLLGRIGEPSDIASAVAFLCSDQARFITGATLVVDGGMTISYA